MPHPIYGPPSHKLSLVSFHLHLPLRSNEYQTHLEVQGRASTQRANLWSVSERWEATDVDAGLAPTDALHHLALIATQDHPTTQEQLFAALTGERWIQEELPL